MDADLTIGVREISPGVYRAWVQLCTLTGCWSITVEKAAVKFEPKIAAKVVGAIEEELDDQEDDDEDGEEDEGEETEEAPLPGEPSQASTPAPGAPPAQLTQEAKGKLLSHVQQKAKTAAKKAAVKTALKQAEAFTKSPAGKVLVPPSAKAAIKAVKVVHTLAKQAKKGHQAAMGALERICGSDHQLCRGAVATVRNFF